MENLIEKIKKETTLQIVQKVAQLGNAAHDFDEISNKLTNEFKIQPPKLQPCETQVFIGQESVSKHEASTGSPPGQTVYYALYTVPVEGSYILLAQLLKHHPKKSNFHYSFGRICFKETSLTPIIENARVIEKIKSKAEARISEIDGLLVEFSTKADLFNTTTLEEIINSELKKISDKRTSEEALNPFYTQ